MIWVGFPTSKSTKNQSKIQPNSPTTKIATIIKITICFTMFFATSAMPCCGKKSTRMLPRAFQKHLSNQHPNLHRFWNQLGSILGGLWEPSWSQVGTKSLQKSIPKVIKITITISMASGWIFDRFWLPTCLPRGGPRMELSRFGGLLGPP